MFLQEPKYTGRECGTKRSWTHAGKLAFNDYMLKVCRDRIARGGGFDSKLQLFWQKKYKKSRLTSGKDADGNDKPKRARVVTYSDHAIKMLVAKSDNEPNPEPEESWDENEDLPVVTDLERMMVIV